MSASQADNTCEKPTQQTKYHHKNKVYKPLHSCFPSDDYILLKVIHFFTYTKIMADDTELRRLRAITQVLQSHTNSIQDRLSKYEDRDHVLIRKTRSYMHYLIPDDDWDDDYIYEGMHIRQLAVAFHDIEKFIKRGDLVSDTRSSGYRASGVYVFDGYCLGALSAEYDGYPHIPDHYTIIDEFPVGYWDDATLDNDHILIYYDNEVYTPREYAIDVYENADGSIPSNFQDFYWHISDPYIEFINMYRLGIYEDYKKLRHACTSDHTLDWPTKVDVECGQNVYVSVPYIAFSWSGQRYSLILEYEYTENGDSWSDKPVIPVFQTDIESSENSAEHTDHMGIVFTTKL